PLSQLTTMSGGITMLEGASITTQGNQSFNNAVQSSGHTTLTTQNQVLISPSLSLQGTLTIANAAAETLTTPISGDGTLVKASTGVLTLSGTNNIGELAIDRGTVIFHSLSNLGNALAMRGGNLTWAPGNTADISSLLQALTPTSAPIF